VTTPGGGWDVPIVGGTILRIPAIMSPNYVAGVSGWAIFQTGDAEFNDIELHGNVIIDNNVNGVFIYAT
jgi:hypothetical protein